MKTLAILILAAALTGCATMGGVKVKSDPEGATVRFSDGTTCTTPCDIVIQGEYPVEATFSRVGYKSVTVRMTPGSFGYRPNPLFVTMELVAPTIGVQAEPLAPAQ